MFDTSGSLSMDRFSVGKTPETYEYWVNETAKLINKPYFVAHKMIGDWTVDQIRDRYIEATKVDGMPKDVWWFWKRKQDKKLTKDLNKK